MKRLTRAAIQAKFWANVDKTAACWLWTLSLNHGYGQIWINGKRWIAPRLAWVLTHGPIRKRRQFVCHRCDNPACVRPDHLFLASQTINLADMRAKGRGALPPPQRGAVNVNATFSDDDIREIRRRYAKGDSLRTLGRHYKVWHTTISGIVRRRTWRHIT